MDRFGAVGRSAGTKFVIAGLIAALCACTASGPPFTPATETSSDNALVYVYRPDTLFYSADPDVPILYLDGVRLLRLRINGYTWLEVEPGQHAISLKESLLGLPSWTIGEIDLPAESGRTYYIRYTYDYAGTAFDGTYAYATGQSTFTIVPNALGKQEISGTRYIAPEEQ